MERWVGFVGGRGRGQAGVNADLPPLDAPFRAERYDTAERLSALIAPPYDVIAPEERARYAARDPHNIVRLILREAPPGADRYGRAAAELAAWRGEGILASDPQEGVYVVAQDYALPGGQRRPRLGLFAAVRAEPVAPMRGAPP